VVVGVAGVTGAAPWAEGADGGRPRAVASGADRPAPAGSSGGVAATAVPAPGGARPGAALGRPAPTDPVSLSVPSIRVTTPLERLGVDRSGSLQVPVAYERAGWFAQGPAPGEPGPAVVAGHVDSKSGPAVFYRLRELQPGALVTVRRRDGRTVDFRVVEVRRYPKTAFPSSEVYGPTPGRELRLITCGGAFDASRGSYRDNVIAYAVAA